MEIPKEFDNVDVLPIGEDVRHLDEPSNNIVNMFDGRDWYFGKTPKGGVPQHPAKFTRDDVDCCTSRINDTLAVKYAMLFAEQEHK